MSAPTRREPAYAEQLAQTFCRLDLAQLPPRALEVATDELIDVVGLAIAARRTSYVRAVLGACESQGPCTALGHSTRFDAPGAALVNGTAAHGEDFDDTLEGTPCHIGATVVPAVLAVAERDGRSGQDVVRGIIAGAELACRMSFVTPGGMHRACFHPTAVVGSFAAAVGACVTLGLDAKQLTHALGIAGSLSSGIIEYLTEGAWTKRLHAGWAAHSGVRAASLARAGFNGPRTVFEGTHNVFRAFAPSAEPDYQAFTDALGREWRMQQIAFKPYPCGTMIHPYVDCMMRFADAGVAVDDIAAIECDTAQAIVHRLWEPLADKQRPPNAYAAKFSVPFCMAVVLLERELGLAQFSEQTVADPRVHALAARIGYRIDPASEYPRNYTGHARVELRDGRILEFRQPHFRGGVREPLTRKQLEDKFRGNVRFGGYDAQKGEQLLHFCRNIARSGHVDASSV